MAGIEDLCDAIADALYVEKAYDLPEACEKLGLEPGTSEDAYSSKRWYVKSRLKDKPRDFLVEIAHRVYEYYYDRQLRKVLGEFLSDHHQVSLVTRRNILDELTLMEQATKQPIAGRLSLVDLLRRVLPLDDMPSSDFRFTNASADIAQHMIHNHDWDYEYLFDTYLGLLKGFDEDFLLFLEAVVHPLARVGDEQQTYVKTINGHLSADGYTLQAREQVSAYPVYRAFPLVAGVEKSVKNLIFAAIGPKPELILEDSVSNDIRIVRNAEYCLVYDLPIPQTGLLWRDLVVWWAGLRGLAASDIETERQLYSRLVQSLGSEPEQLVCQTYFGAFHSELADRLPALVPQVYLHYDPYTLRQLEGGKRLPRQRMDFLMLFSNYERVVIEVDGVQHYSQDGHPSPARYAEMVAADRDLRLTGYEIYRFGGAELHGKTGKALLETFFRRLLERHGVIS